MMEEPEYHIPSDELIELFDLGHKASLQPPRFAKVTASDASTVTVTLGGEDVEAVRCCVCSAGDVVLLETLPSGRLAAVGARGASGGTTYTAGTGLTLDGTTINHSNAVTAGTIGTSSATSGASIAVPYATYDAQGHITAKGTHTHTVNGINLASAVTGTLPIANGGTGASTAFLASQYLRNARVTMTGASTVGWYKLLEYANPSGFRQLRLSVIDARYSANGGILDIQTQYNSGSIEIRKFSWMCASGIDPSYYLLDVDNDTYTVSLYVYTPTSGRNVIIELMATGTQYSWINSTFVTLYHPTTPESATPSGTASTIGHVAGNTTWYANCSTAAGTAAKVANVSDDSFALVRGVTVHCYFSTANTVAGAITLNVNNTGAITVSRGSAATSASNTALWQPGCMMTFVYTGNYWIMISNSQSIIGGRTRPTDANALVSPGSVQLRHDLSTSAMTSNKPTLGYDTTGHILTMDWDTSGLYAAQLFIPLASNDGDVVQWRAQGNTSSWDAWRPLVSVVEYSGGTTMATCRSSGGWGWRAEKFSDGRMRLHVWNRYSISATTSYQTLSLPAASALAVFTDFPVIHTTAISTTTTNDAWMCSVNSATMSTSSAQGSLSIGVRRTNSDATIVINATLEGHWR